MCGGTSPATLASTLIMANAELLSSFVLSKSVNPAVPLIYASWARVLDIKVATVSHGGPEFSLLRIGTTQMAKYYGLPSDGGGILADTKSIDVQLGMEKLGTGLLPALAAKRIVEDAKALEDAGVFPMILEAVPAPLGQLVGLVLFVPVCFCMKLIKQITL